VRMRASDRATSLIIGAFTTSSGWSLFQYAHLFKDILCVLAFAVSPVIHSCNIFSAEYLARELMQE
jgi:hypothetical protein